MGFGTLRTSTSINIKTLKEIAKRIYLSCEEVSDNYIHYNGNWYKVEKVDNVPFDVILSVMEKETNEENREFLKENTPKQLDTDMLGDSKVEKINSLET